MDDKVEKISDEAKELLPVISHNKVAFSMLLLGLALGWITWKIDWNELMLRKVNADIQNSALPKERKKEADKSIEKLIRIDAE